jgi:pimeloyl-ACP methyl ester carboxylesterase
VSPEVWPHTAPHTLREVLREKEAAMPTTRRSGLAIHYELVGSGPPLVLLHGGFASSGTWRLEGYVEALQVDHLLVLADARGHGRSDKPHEAASYSTSNEASDVLAVLDEVGLSSAALCGFSMGAITALRVAACHPARVDAVAAISSDPEGVGFADLPAAKSDDSWAQRFEREGMAWIVADLEREGRHAWARLVEQGDPVAMAAMLRGPVEPIPQRLKDLAAPSLFAWGEQEVREGDEAILPVGARFLVVPGADHVGTLERSDLLIPEIRSLLAGIRSEPIATPGAR